MLHLGGEPLPGLFFADCAEPSVDPYAAVFFVDDALAGRVDYVGVRVLGIRRLLRRMDLQIVAASWRERLPRRGVPLLPLYKF